MKSYYYYFLLMQSEILVIFFFLRRCLFIDINFSSKYEEIDEKAELYKSECKWPATLYYKKQKGKTHNSSLSDIIFAFITFYTSYREESTNDMFPKILLFPYYWFFSLFFPCTVLFTISWHNNTGSYENFAHTYYS